MKVSKKDKEMLLNNLERMRKEMCSYSNSDNFCDCKFGTDTDKWQPVISERFSGCAELRLAMEIIKEDL